MRNAPLQRGLVVTKLLSDIQRGEADAVQFALAMLAFTAHDLSEFSAMVVLTHCRDSGELTQIQRFLSNNRVHRITAAISRSARVIPESLPAP